MISVFNPPERSLAVLYAILLTCITFSATLELFAHASAQAAGTVLLA